MDPAAVLRTVLALAIGFLLGSVLPADLFARRRGLDIRTVGDGNPGTVNAFKGLGWGWGLLTAMYDVSVGVVAIRVAVLLGVAEGGAYLAGLMAVAGHRYPAFSRFRGGGQGMAACAGLLVYGIAVALSRGWMSVTGLVALMAILLAAMALARSDKAGTVVMLPVLVVMLVFGRPDLVFLAFMLAVSAYMWTVQLNAIRRRHVVFRPMHGRR